MKITELTRRDIIDSIASEAASWSGRLEEAEFLGRLFDLQKLSCSAVDGFQHRHTGLGRVGSSQGKDRGHAQQARPGGGQFHFKRLVHC